jgi:SAM-dependent methyltransferase
MFRTGLIKYWWRYRHLLDGSYRPVPPEPDRVDPHREQIWSLIAPFNPRSLLEIGSGDGANLVLLAKKAPSLQLSAVDINPFALAIAERRVQAAGGTTYHFHQGTTDPLPFAEGRFDVSLSDAVFMYLTPPHVVTALREMRRVSHRAIIVHTLADDRRATSAIIAGNWVHAFERLAAAAIPGSSVTCHPSEASSSEQWRMFGAAYVISW